MDLQTIYRMKPQTVYRIVWQTDLGKQIGYEASEGTAHALEMPLLVASLKRSSFVEDAWIESRQVTPWQRCE